ncbi:MAG: hypothetical protein V4438_00330 [Patescibacteria group bacterium]
MSHLQGICQNHHKECLHYTAEQGILTDLKLLNYQSRWWGKWVHIDYRSSNAARLQDSQ